jgi:hypothetical protein
MRGGVSACLAAGLLLAGLAAQGQTPDPASAERPRLVLDLGMGQGKPGDEVVIPATLRVADGAEVGAFTLKVSFPRALVSFEEVRKAIGAQAANAEVTSALEEPAPGAEQASATISVTAEAGKALGSGTVVDLVFKVAEQAPLESVAALSGQILAMAAGASPAPIAPAQVDDGEVAVAETTLMFSCFFYMH